MSTSPSAERLFSDIAQFIADSRAILEEGALVQLNGLDEQVRMLCSEVMQLTQEERVAYADRLQDLLLGLKALGDELVVRRDRIADEIRGISHFKKATVAYRTTEAIDNYRPDEGDDDAQ